MHDTVPDRGNTFLQAKLSFILSGDACNQLYAAMPGGGKKFPAPQILRPANKPMIVLPARGAFDTGPTALIILDHGKLYKFSAETRIYTIVRYSRSRKTDLILSWHTLQRIRLTWVDAALQHIQRVDTAEAEVGS